MNKVSLWTRDDHREDWMVPSPGEPPSSVPPRGASIKHEHARPQYVRRACSWWSAVPSSYCFWARYSRWFWDASTLKPSRRHWIWCESIIPSLFSTHPELHGWSVFSNSTLCSNSLTDRMSCEKWRFLGAVIADDLYPNRDDPPAFNENQDFDFGLDNKTIRRAFIRKVIIHSLSVRCLWF